MRQMKKIAVTTVATALALALTSCSGAGTDAATRMITRVTDGAEAVINNDGADIRVSNLLVVATGNGDAVVVGHIVNRADAADKLISISAADAPAKLSGLTDLVKNAPIHFEGSSANAKAVFAGLNPVAGKNIALTLTFAKAGIVTVNVVIRDTRDIYADVTSAQK